MCAVFVFSLEGRLGEDSSVFDLALVNLSSIVPLSIRAFGKNNSVQSTDSSEICICGNGCMIAQNKNARSNSRDRVSGYQNRTCLKQTSLKYIFDGQ